jgi:hypothetical protein
LNVRFICGKKCASNLSLTDIVKLSNYCFSPALSQTKSIDLVYNRVGNIFRIVHLGRSKIQKKIEKAFDFISMYKITTEIKM